MENQTPMDDLVVKQLLAVPQFSHLWFSEGWLNGDGSSTVHTIGKK